MKSPGGTLLTRLFGLDGRVAIVTGASSGLGEALAVGLAAAAGARVGLAARRVERLDALAERIDGLAVGCDLLGESSVSQLVGRVAERLGPPEILINAAGALNGVHRAETEPVQAIRATMAAGLFRSEMTDEMYTNERTAEWLRKNTLLPDAADSQDFVGAALWLTSDAGRYVTGQTIIVDGGWTAR